MVFGKTKLEGEERARLIAAAPDLLEALVAAEYAMGNVVKPGSIAQHDDRVAWAEAYFLPLARAAIAKAVSPSTASPA